MQLRYSFRLYPDAGQRIALSRAFGCDRVVFNDAVLHDGCAADLQREWLGAEPSVVIEEGAA